MSFSKICIAIYEGLNDPQQAAAGGLLRGPIVVAGVHRKCAVGIKDTRIENWRNTSGCVRPHDAI